MISQENFKIALNAMWAGYVRAMGLINTLNVMGLEACDAKPMDKSNPDVDPKFLTFGELYGIQGAMAPAIIKLVGGDPKTPTAAGAATLLEEIDFFLCEVGEYCPHSDTFPEEWYPKLMQILTISGKITMPWLKTETPKSRGRIGDIGGAYWNNDVLGVTAQYATVDEIYADGFNQYTFQLLCTSMSGENVEMRDSKVIQIWGRTWEEAENVLKSLMSSDLEEYAWMKSREFKHKENKS